MENELISVNGRIMSKKVFKIGQEMGMVKCDTLARDSFYECKTFDDEHGVEHLVLVQYDPNIVAGKVKGVVVGSFRKSNKNYFVALMEDATFCVVGNHANRKLYSQVSDKVKDMKIIGGEKDLKIMCKPLYSSEVAELKLREPLLKPASGAGIN